MVGCADNAMDWQCRELLAVLALAAARSHRRALIMRLPRILDSDGSPPLLLNPDQPDYDALISALESVAVSAGEAGEEDMEQAHGIAAPLITWLTGTVSRPTLMPAAADVAGGGGCANRLRLPGLVLQYRVRWADEDEAMGGDGQGRSKDSFLAWHGSPLENWHGILRHGLKVRWHGVYGGKGSEKLCRLWCKSGDGSQEGGSAEWTRANDQAEYDFEHGREGGSNGKDES